VVGDIYIPDGWNEGDFELNINRCFNCNHHFDYCWHMEEDFVNNFNALGEFVSQVFPKVSVIGNYEAPKMLGDFEVYIRSVGF
jgi:hypothetical protein